METEKKEMNDCGCSDNCCSPKKKNPAIKIIFIIVVLSALGIAGFKLFSNNEKKSVVTKEQKETTTPCCDSKKTDNCDTTSKSCCSK